MHHNLMSVDREGRESYTSDHPGAWEVGKEQLSLHLHGYLALEDEKRPLWGESRDENFPSPPSPWELPFWAAGKQLSCGPSQLAHQAW